MLFGEAEVEGTKPLETLTVRVASFRWRVGLAWNRGEGFTERKVWIELQTRYWGLGEKKRLIGSKQ